MLLGWWQYDEVVRFPLYPLKTVLVLFYENATVSYRLRGSLDK